MRIDNTADDAALDDSYGADDDHDDNYDDDNDDDDVDDDDGDDDDVHRGWHGQILVWSGFDAWTGLI